jgi:Cell wall hydrolyses involved in spore germination
MKKRLFVFLLVCVICVANFIPASAEARDVSVYINGNSFQAGVPVVLINSTTYVPLRYFSQALSGVDVSWDDASQTAYVGNSSVSLSVRVGAQYMTVNGRYFYLPNSCLIINNSTMVPVRELCKAFGASVEWNGETNSVYVYTGSGSIEWGDSYYDNDSVYWLSRVIYSESGGESLSGQIAVGNVVMNRVHSNKYPNNIYDVIFQPNQFSPVASGAIYRTPSEMSVIAAKICLEGYNVAGDSLYFCNPRITSSSWFANRLTLMTVIGNHAFYA